ncbi:hypothetical protein Hanom_Chr17g01589531 [Helianthus anomalus]
MTGCNLYTISLFLRCSVSCLLYNLLLRPACGMHIQCIYVWTLGGKSESALISTLFY